jgi:2-polyprenyl-3-methyl-5-hydroxy-6-metoxy-1,4-benzoquinol methylase
MLHAAAGLTLDLARESLTEGFGLKDATPYNVLFRGAQPVFVDLLSFERREPLDPTWRAYAQFVRTFLLPLLAAKSFGVQPHALLANSRDGVEPESLYQWSRPLHRLKPPFLSLVAMPKWLSGKKTDDASVYQPRPAASQEQARFILDSLLKNCAKHLRAVAPRPADSAWTSYLDSKSLYSPQQLAQKEAFVSEALELARPARVLDVGANEGHFSAMAAQHGASVVAIDSDPAVAGAIYRRASTENLNILPLVVDLTRPTPAVGWRNQENTSFLDRARDMSFDFVMELAVIHHMLVTERIPLPDLLDLTAELTREFALIEYVAPADPMFRRIVRGRESLYAHLTREYFEAAAKQRFELVRSTQIDGLQRWLYLFRRRPNQN